MDREFKKYCEMYRDKGCEFDRMKHSLPINLQEKSIIELDDIFCIVERLDSTKKASRLHSHDKRLKFCSNHSGGTYERS